MSDQDISPCGAARRCEGMQERGIPMSRPRSIRLEFACLGCRASEFRLCQTDKPIARTAFTTAPSGCRCSIPVLVLFSPAGSQWTRGDQRWIAESFALAIKEQEAVATNNTETVH